MSLLEVSDLSVVFPGGRGTLPWQRLPNVRAVQGANLSIRASESVGLVGESGSGKTTLGRAILRLLHPTEGTIRLGDFDVTGFGRRTPRAYRKAVQVVFQDPVGSLNPAMTVRDIVAEPLRLNMGLQGEALGERVDQDGIEPVDAVPMGCQQRGGAGHGVGHESSPRAHPTSVSRRYATRDGIWMC